MKLKPYQNYKNSGVQWLGNVPDDWVITPIKRLGRLKGGAGFPHEEQAVVGEELDFHKVNALGSAFTDGLLRKSENTISKETAQKLGAYIFPKQSIVFAKVGAALLLGRIRELANPSCIDNNMMGLVVDQKSRSVSFTKYAMNLVRFDQISNPGTVPSLNESQIGNFPLVFPDKTQQTLIADFLDRETAKLDNLIAKQEKLIELLQEKRQAIISHAVSKGLDPNVKMKDSGDEWLRMVPQHWDVFKGKKLFEITKRIAGKLGYDVLSITQKGIKVKDITSGDGQLSMDYSKYQLVEHGDFAMNHMDLLTGFVDISNFNGVTSPDYRVFKLKDKVKNFAEYYLFVIQNCYTEKLFFPYGQGSSQLGRWRLPTEAFNYFNYPSPPFEEQLKIVQFLKKTISRIDTLISKSERSIELAKEHRTALISAAVTGKIDVREYVQ